MNKEKVLVVPASCLWDHVKHIKKGLITEGTEELTSLIACCGSFVDRTAAENDPSHKQVIPYAVVHHSNSFFLLQRKNAQNERRLHNKLSIGVGGHINPSEMSLAEDVIRHGLAREIEEELNIASKYSEHLVGLINDDTTDVGSVHLGVLFEIDSASFDVSVRETHKMEGSWMPFERLGESYPRLETWSQIVYDSYLCTRKPRNLRNGTTG
ncbi:MAG TPA: NUDIX domain-containing protein [Bryobacteraceae bacterium]|jgi:predicted NUDIX family phosphoesterase